MFHFSFLQIIISSVILLNLVCGLTNMTCDDEESCYDGDYVKTDIYCRGYKACWDSTLNCSDICSCGGLLACHNGDITTGSDAVCNGEYGCKYATITSDDDIWCDGRYGCKFTTLTASTNIYCDGEYSCRLNTIKSANYIYARGFGSLQNSDIYGFSRIYANGYLALTNAVINTTGITTTISVFGGDDTTMNAKFICADDSTCYIYCTTSSGCNKLKVFCYGTCVVSCDDEWQSCPNTTDISSSSSNDAFDENVLFEELAQRENYRENEFEKEMEQDESLLSSSLRVAPIVAFGDESSNSLLNTYVANNSQEIKFLIIGLAAGLIISATAYSIMVSKKNSKYQRDFGYNYQTLA